MKRLALLLVMGMGLFVGEALAQQGNPPGVQLQDEGIVLGQVLKLNCVGTAITCTRSSALGTLTVSGGGGGGDLTAKYWIGATAGDLPNAFNLGALTTGLVLNTVAAGTGTPSAYGGTDCGAGNAIRSLDASGAHSNCLTLTTGTVTSVATTSPITGGTITSTGTIACATCVTSASALTSNLPVIGQGLQATAVGTRSGNTTGFATFTGATSSGKCLEWDASGNVVTAVSNAACGSGGGASLDAISAAVANQTGILNADFNIVWEWAKTTDTTVAMTLGESAAATNGTSTSGVPNQVLLKLSTLAASTMSPLSVYSRGSHVFSVSPTSAQIFSNSGSATLPSYSFAAGTAMGMYYDGFGPALTNNGAIQLSVRSGVLRGPVGTATAPAITDKTSATTGPYFGSHFMGIADSTDGEWARFLSFAFQVNRADASATGYALNARKARGTVASPTVITTGDDLLTINAYGYVGATNTYRNVATILFDSTGTISDATNGIGGIISLATQLQGTDTSPQVNLTCQGGSKGFCTFGSVTFANLPTPANGSVLYCSDCDAPTLVDQTCASVGAKTGSLAVYTNGAWKCIS